MTAVARSQVSVEPRNEGLYDAWSMAFSGHGDVARDLLRGILSREPDNTDALEAMAVLDMGIDLTPAGQAPRSRVPAARLEAVRLLLRTGDRVQDAVEEVERLLYDHPDDTDLLCLAGDVALDEERLSDALECFTAVLSRDPLNSDALLGRGAVLFRMDDLGIIGGDGRDDLLGAAAATYKVVLIRHPRLVQANQRMGILSRRRRRLNDAITYFRTALDIEPENVDVLVQLAHVLMISGNGEEAWEHLEAALALDPVQEDVLVNMGVHLQQQGDNEAALALWERALAINPSNICALQNVSDLRTYTPDHPEIERMRILAGRTDCKVESRWVLASALYNALNRAGETEEALSYLWEANRLRRTRESFSITKEREQHTAFKAPFASDHPLPVPTDYDATLQDGPRPIFIVGMPRSGSTLTEQILASHSQVTGIGEVTYLSTAIHSALLRAVQRRRGILTQDSVDLVRRLYRAQVAEMGVDTPVMVDKMLWNYRYVGVILAAFPEAKIIVMNRDPMAIGWSIWKLFFAESGPEYAYDLTEIGQTYRLYEDLMDFWRARFPGRLHDLFYESLTEHQEAETRTLLAYCDLPWEDACLRFHETKRSVYTASKVQVKTAMYKGSSEAWKTYADALRPLSDALAAPLPPLTGVLDYVLAMQEAANRGARGDFKGVRDIADRLLQRIGESQMARGISSRDEGLVPGAMPLPHSVGKDGMGGNHRPSLGKSCPVTGESMIPKIENGRGSGQ
ncbi:MAG: sulfotransferase [Rhodospirillum sp.]|nr:sulfotransferase [Rhodospirillum sp.]MCF8491684.1 sulfotransferase [Rhodospirillum sp.]MCF8501073.1 sulfotransferase [Rhodospirillum sp.]